VAPSGSVLCPHCQLPHEAGLKTCPITGLPLTDTETRLPSARDELGLIGTLVSDKYEVRRELGTGAMGAVYEAEHVKIGRDVALKVLGRSYAREDRIRDRFVTEAQATGRVEHENVVEIWDVGATEEGLPYMVMELLDGETLAARIDRERRLPLADALHIARQLLAGLAAAHEAGVVHRDVKPENIVLTDGDHVKIVDFGFARILDSGKMSITQTGDLVGTPSYLPPEQSDGVRLDDRADAWSATVVLYEMVTGELPFPGQSMIEVLAAVATSEPPRPSTERPYLPEGLDHLVHVGLQKDRERRARVPELLAGVIELERALHGTADSVMEEIVDEVDAPRRRPPRRSAELDKTREDHGPPASLEGGGVEDTLDEDGAA